MKRPIHLLGQMATRLAPEERLSTFRRAVESAVRDRRAARQERGAGGSNDARYRALVEHSANGFIIAEKDGTIRYAGPSIEPIFGVSARDLAGTSTYELIHPDDVERVRQALEMTQPGNGQGVAYEEFRASPEAGEGRWVGMSARNLIDNPEVGGFVLSCHDVSSRKLLEAQQKERPLFDKLTGLPNRTLLEDRIEQAIHAAARIHEPVAILLMNIDQFKDVNDALGHTAGDLVLRMVADRLAPALRASDTFARLIGDEFVALLRSSDDESALMVAERIEAVLDEPFIVSRQPIALSASMGISFYPEHGQDAEVLLQHADVALQNARALRATCAVYRSEEDEHSARRLGLRAELRATIEQDGLIQYYQPKRSLRNGVVDEVEALVRWAHPAHGFVSPEEFIPTAERWNSIKPLTMWALRTATRQCAAWTDAGFNLGVSVNLSARDLNDRELPNEVAEILTAASVPPASLVLEVTESMLMIDPDRARFVLDQLRALGVRISVDDFGTGYSSLAYLSRLPIDELKIDKSFVAGMSESEQDRLIVAATIDLGHRLGLTVAAEGVEDEPTEKMLLDMSCDKVQGYYVSRPLPANELTRWMVSKG